MVGNISNLSVLAILLSFLHIMPAKAQVNSLDKHRKVTMRMIGHEVLLLCGDSTSRVLPIEKTENQYKIPFESDYHFDPDDLVELVSRIMAEANAADHYIVEVQRCEGEEIVYSFEIGNTLESSMMPCAMRAPPMDCYNILITIIEGSASFAALADLGISGPGGDFPVSSQTTKMKWFGLGILSILVISGGIYWFYSSRNKEEESDPNVINIGDYQYDMRNTELVYDEQRIELTKKEADLLLLLYDTANTTVEREVILKMVWGNEGGYVGRTLDVFISKLRKKLESNKRVKIVNIRGVGYKLVVNN